jgi:gliding motility-associated lipoprotein GldH
MRFFAVIGFLLVLSGCDQSRVYELDHDLDGHFWRVKEIPTFEFAVTDSTQLYNIYYRVRNSSDYPYARIFVKYSLMDPANKELQSKLVSNYLFDQKSGVPLGSSGIGDKFDHQFLILDKQKFNKTGKFKVTLEQFMRTDTLPGVESIGIRVEKQISNL